MFFYGYINKKYHVHNWPSELLWYFAAIRKTLKETKRDVNTLGGNTFGLLEEAYLGCWKAILIEEAHLGCWKSTLIILKSMIMWYNDSWMK